MLKTTTRNLAVLASLSALSASCHDARGEYSLESKQSTTELEPMRAELEERTVQSLQAELQYLERANILTVLELAASCNFQGSSSAAISSAVKLINECLEEARIEWDRVSVAQYLTPSEKPEVVNLASEIAVYENLIEIFVSFEKDHVSRDNSPSLKDLREQLVAAKVGDPAAIAIAEAHLNDRMALLNSDFESQYYRRRFAILDAVLVQGYSQETTTNALRSAASAINDAIQADLKVAEVAIKNAYSGEENREDDKVAIKLYDRWATRLEQLPDIDLRTQRSKDIAARLIRLSMRLRP